MTTLTATILTLLVHVISSQAGRGAGLASAAYKGWQARRRAKAEDAMLERLRGQLANVDSEPDLPKEGT